MAYENASKCSISGENIHKFLGDITSPLDVFDVPPPEMKCSVRVCCFNLVLRTCNLLIALCSDFC